VEASLDAALPDPTRAPQRLHAAMRHAALGGGKRMRPLLVYAAGTMTGADEGVLDAPATAVELIHAYSLVHDDLPAMDDDALRRGQPTVHIAFDEATAVLAGDALQTLAFEVLAGSAYRAVGQQPGAFIGGDKRQGHGLNPHETEDARMRFCAEAQNCRAVSAHPCASTNTQSIASVEERKRTSGIVESGKDTDPIP